MNYYYILLAITFFVLAKQSQLILKIKDSYLSSKSIYQYYLISMFIGYIALFFSLFKNFYWIHAILIIIGGFTVLPFLIGFIIPNKLNKLLETNINFLTIPVILSVISSVLLVMNLL